MKVFGLTSRKWFASIGNFLFFPTLVFAQKSIIDGRITDQQGYAISHAQVSLTNAKDKRIEEALTSDEGGFSFNDVSSGRYVLAVRAPGFEPVERPVIASSSGTVTINVKLRVAAERQAVTVTADVNEA